METIDPIKELLGLLKAKNCFPVVTQEGAWDLSKKFELKFPVLTFTVIFTRGNAVGDSYGYHVSVTYLRPSLCESSTVELDSVAGKYGPVSMLIGLLTTLAAQMFPHPSDIQELELALKQ